MSYIPNLLTLLRIAAAPVLVVLLQDRSYELALALFILAGLSDGLDGYIAKRFECESRLGAILDPIADKLLLVSAYVMLTVLHHLPFWLLVAVVFRDLLIVGGYLVVATLNGAAPMRPSTMSKVNTLMQIVLVSVVLAQQAGIVDMIYTVQVLIAIVFATTSVSGAHYVWVWGIRKEWAEPDAGAEQQSASMIEPPAASQARVTRSG